MRDDMVFCACHLDGLHRIEHLADGAGHPTRGLAACFTQVMDACGRHLRKSNDTDERDKYEQRDTCADAQQNADGNDRERTHANGIQCPADGVFGVVGIFTQAAKRITRRVFQSRCARLLENGRQNISAQQCAHGKAVTLVYKDTADEKPAAPNGCDDQ